MSVRFKTLYFSIGSMLSLFVILKITSYLSGMHVPLSAYCIGMAFTGFVACPFHAMLITNWEENRRLRSELEQMVCKLHQKAETDGLTGLLTRSAFVERVKAVSAKDRTWLLIVDIDHFKDINDNHGHLAGDAILRVVGYAIRSVLRPGDVGGRMGGEEFGLCLVAQDADGAAHTAELLRASIQALGVEAPSGGMLRATVSIGLASCEAGALKDSFHAADLAMYAAKTAGRNQVQLAA